MNALSLSGGIRSAAPLHPSRVGAVTPRGGQSAPVSRADVSDQAARSAPASSFRIEETGGLVWVVSADGTERSPCASRAVAERLASARENSGPLFRQ